MNWIRSLLVLFLACSLGAAQSGQPEDSPGAQGVEPVEQIERFERFELRAQLTRGDGRVLVDRGARDGLKEGDPVFFYLTTGTRRGRVVESEERTSWVQLGGPGPEVPVGARGEVRIPLARFQAPDEPGLGQPAETPSAGVEENQGQAPQPADRWSRGKDDWQMGSPLLAGIRAFNPHERPATIEGRAYGVADFNRSSQGSRSDHFLRLGVDLDAYNLLGKGEVLSLDVEANKRDTDVPDEDDESRSDLRIDRLSYAIGGTRDRWNRWEAGRFLQYGMPEFGVLDGLEFGSRRGSGHRYGGSIGFMPEPDADQDSSHDFQISGWYRWVQSMEETLALSAGLQKTWHNGAPDRDLIIAKAEYLPQDGWHWHSAAWIDLYGGSDRIKGSGLGLTQAYVLGSKNTESGGYDVRLDHLEFPELQRNEFLPVAPSQLADDRRDRAAFGIWRQTSERTRLHGEVGLWNDEDESGADLELGIDRADFFGDGTHAGLSAFGTQGRFSQWIGARAEAGTRRARTNFDLYYEIAQNDIDGFDSDADTHIHHRLGAGADLRLGHGWTVHTSVDAFVWDEDENGFALTLFVQRLF